MVEFRYRGIEKTGSKITGSLQATNEKNAYVALSQSEIVPISIWEAGSEVHELKWWQRDVSLFSSTIPPRDLAIASKAIAILLEAGLPLKDALSAAIESSPKSLKPILVSVTRQLEQGEALTTAFSRHKNKLPETFLMLVEVGETANCLPAVLLRAAAHFDIQAENSRKLIGALIYPAILVLFSFFLLGVLVFFLVPALEPLFTSSGLELPAVLSILLTAKLVLFEYGIAFFLVVFALPFAMSSLNATDPGKRLLQALALRVPYLGRRMVLGDLARFIHALSVMMQSGLSFQKSMQAGSKTFHLRVLRDLAQISIEEMKQGGSFTEQFTSSPLIGKDIKQLILLADKSNQWQQIMEETAKVLDTQIEQADQRLTNLITPFITIFIGATIGILVVSVVSAILEINELAFQ